MIQRNQPIGLEDYTMRINSILLVSTFILILSVFTHPFAAHADAKTFYQKQLKSPATTFLVDVREPDEAASEGMAKDARLVPTTVIDANGPAWQQLLDDLNKAKTHSYLTIGIYCRSGHRSSLVKSRLEALGFSVENLGGFSDWKKEQLPTESYKKP